MIQDYLSQIFNINMMMQDSIDEIMDLTQESIENLSSEELFELHKELVKLQRDVTERFVYPIQDLCIDIGQTIVKNNTGDKQ